MIGEPVVAVCHIQKGIPGNHVRQRVRHGAQFDGFYMPALDLAQYVTHESPHQIRG